MRTIVLCGNSLVVSAVGAGLEECEEVQLVRMDAASNDAAKRLAALDPAAVIFDRTVTRPDLAVTLLFEHWFNEHPEVLLIGVDPSSSSVLLLSGREERPVSPADLLRVVVEGHPGRKWR